MRRIATCVLGALLCALDAAPSAAQAVSGTPPQGGTFTASLWGENVVTMFEFVDDGGKTYLHVLPGEKSIGVSSDIADLLWDAVDAQQKNVAAAAVDEIAVTIIPLRVHGYRTVAGPHGWHQYFDPVRKGRSISKGMEYDVVQRRRIIAFEKGQLEIRHADESKGCHVFTFGDGAQILPAAAGGAITARGITYELRQQQCTEFGAMPAPRR
jgi:hypothetical protein